MPWGRFFGYEFMIYFVAWDNLNDIIGNDDENKEN
jgi:hypothetical protein